MHPRTPRAPRLRMHSLAAFLHSIAALLLSGCIGAWALPPQHPPTPPPGVSIPGLQHLMADLHLQATFHAAGMPDWMAVTPDAVWVTSSHAGLVTRLDPSTNQSGATISANKPCSGLVFAFGSLWIPSCGDHTLLRANPNTATVIARIPAGPADSEGGVTAGAGSVWLVTDGGSATKQGTLTRVDAATNRVQTTIPITSGSYNPFFADGFVWISSHDHDALLKVDPATNLLLATIPVGKGPRFLTAGDGAVWTLNQGDGTLSRVDTATGKEVARLDAGIPGPGGEITYGFHAVYATVLGFPITRVDAATNKITAQWKGPGGDSIRTGFGSLWLTDLLHGTTWRFAPPSD